LPCTCCSDGHNNVRVVPVVAAVVIVDDSIGAVVVCVVVKLTGVAFDAKIHNIHSSAHDQARKKVYITSV